MKTLATPLAAACLALALVVPYAVRAQAQDAPPAEPQASEPQAPLTAQQQVDYARVQRLWNTHWRRVAAYYIEHEGNYICVPSYDSRLPSSTGQTVAAYRDTAVWQQPYVDDRGRETTRRLVLPEEDAFAAVALIPEIAVGQYGYIHSGNIARIIDEQTLELDRVWLVDADAVRAQYNTLRGNAFDNQAEFREDAATGRDRGDRREIRRDFRDRIGADSDALQWGFTNRNAAADRQSGRAFSRYTWVIKGYRTTALLEDARWPSAQANTPGLQLVIVDIDGTTITAVPVQSIGTGINELQLLHCLSQREVDKAAFVELVLEASRVARDDYVRHVLARLEGEEPAEPGAVTPPPTNAEVELAD